jgi:hypothetical protein
MSRSENYRSFGKCVDVDVESRRKIIEEYAQMKA